MSGQPPNRPIDLDDDDSDATRIRSRPIFASPKATLENPSLVVVYVPAHEATPAADLGRRMPVDRTITIGRHAGNALVVEQVEVSRRHAEVFVENGRAFVRDLGSSNGTRLNERELRSEAAELADGDRITVGTVILKFIGTDAENQFHETIYRLKVEDALTRIHNKRYLLEFLEREVARAQRGRSDLSLVLYDLDHFKRINDTWGHLAGDLVLRESAALVKQMVRREDCYARYGGEEFCLVLPDQKAQGAAAVAEKIRAAIERHPFDWQGTRLPVTVSLGVAEFSLGFDAAGLIASADERLYSAKKSGRNRCVSA
jgi:two-component system cell cycle response regulator